MPAPAKPLVIHHIEGRRSERAAWLCEELGLPYELKSLSTDNFVETMRALEEAHIMRMVPVLEDGDVRLVESGAILEYILWRYGEGRLRPAETASEMADYLQWMHFAEGTGMFRAMMERLAWQLAPNNFPPDVQFLYVGGSRRVLSFAERTLARQPYFAGKEFTAADIMMHFPLRMAPLALQGRIEVVPLFHNDRSGLAEFPHVNAFLDRMAARPAFRRAMARTMPAGPPKR